MKSEQEDESYDTQASGRELLSLFEGADQAILIAPFATRPGLTPVLNVLSPDAELMLFTRWRANEVATGVSDPGVFDQVVERGGRILLHHLLHAKAYIRPGYGALVGSANLTGFALGWDQAGGVELLVEVSDEHPALQSLVQLLKATSAEATADVRDQVIKQAAAFAVERPLADALTEPAPRLNAWLPSYTQPSVLWRVYSGQRGDTVAKLARPDLIALDPPSGLAVPQFNAYVASALLQGLPGQMAYELSNQTTYQAIQRMKELAAEAGLQLDDPERSWQTLSAWLAYFLPERYTRGAGGPTLYG